MSIFGVILFVSALTLTTTSCGDKDKDEDKKEDKKDS